MSFAVKGRIPSAILSGFALSLGYNLFFLVLGIFLPK